MEKARGCPYSTVVSLTEHRSLDLIAIVLEFVNLNFLIFCAAIHVSIFDAVDLENITDLVQIIKTLDNKEWTLDIGE